MGKGWKTAKVEDIGPTKPSFMKGWHSIRHQLGIEAFGVNAVTTGKGEDLIKPHHEDGDSPQQEFFFVHKGQAIFTLDGEKLVLDEGGCLSVEPKVVRSAVAGISPTTLLVVGAPLGQAYQAPDWDKP